MLKWGSAGGGGADEIDLPEAGPSDKLNGSTVVQTVSFTTAAPSTHVRREIADELLSHVQQTQTKPPMLGGIGG